MKKFIFFICVTCLSNLNHSCLGQLIQPKEKYTLADTLRGSLSKFRTCYDVKFYHLDVKINPSNRSIEGSNLFRFKVVSNFKKLQFDLFENLEVDSVVFLKQKLAFARKYNAVFVDFPEELSKDKTAEFTVHYHGYPQVAKNAPWDGGFIFSKDSQGNDWISVACQGLGASVWWPNKDHQSDEADSMKISITSPSQYQEISNGRHLGDEDLGDGFTRHNWLVSNPINNYSVTFYIGKYVHFTDNFVGEKGNLSLDYWALEGHKEIAKKHWDADVKPMLKAFEHWFGAYPFYEDGYKLVEAPFLGMEHQSAIAYGNEFKKGYKGSDLSQSGEGLKWDFITIHESGHEWFGNNITSQDIADMWVHESFTNYSETLFTESLFGKNAGNAYVQGTRKMILNDRPVVGDFGVNKEGSGDMYYKGANMVHNIRQMINNDEKFRSILRGLNRDFYHQTVTGQQIQDYISRKSGINFSKIFEQYLTTTQIPKLAFKVEKRQLFFTWQNCIKGFDMPIKIHFGREKSIIIKPKEGKIQKIKLPSDIRTSSQIYPDANYYVTFAGSL